MVVRSIIGAVLLVPALAPATIAAEAFLCGPSEVIYVEAADLPRLKRTNACIASHFGLTIAEPAPEAPVFRQEKKTAVAKAQSPAKRAALKPSTIEATPRGAPAKLASHVAVAAAATDYRNIRIINAASPDAEWFRHEK